MSRIVILMYHSISLEQHDKRFSCNPALFEQHMLFLKQQGFNFVSFNVIADYLEHNIEPPEKSVIITFDDGFEDNYTNAWPILKEYEIPATIFLVSHLMGKTGEWLKKARSDNVKKMMSWANALEMANSGIDFGGHTSTHVKLTDIGLNEAKQEIAGCKKTIEHHLGREIDVFAYPYGLYSDDIIQSVAQAGFKMACSTRPGFNSKVMDKLLLRRIEVSGTDSVTVLKRKIIFGTNESSIMLPFKYYLSQILKRLKLS